MLNGLYLLFGKKSVALLRTRVFRRIRRGLMILLVNFSSIPTINKDLVPSFFILGERIATFLFAELFFSLKTDNFVCISMLGQLFLLRSARASLIFFNGLFRDFSSLRHMAHARAGLGSSLGQVGQLGARTCRFKGWPEITSATAKRNPFPQLIGPSSFSSKKKTTKKKKFPAPHMRKIEL